MSWATGDTPSRITGGGGSRMPWATHSFKCNGETPPQTTGGEWKLMVLGYSLYGCTPDTPLQERKQHVSLATHSYEWTEDTPWSGSRTSLRPLTLMSVPDGNSFGNHWGEGSSRVGDTVETLPWISDENNSTKLRLN